MNFSGRLLEHAIHLVAEHKDESSDEIGRRRAVSAAYYALFHQINEDAVRLLAPNVPIETNHRIQRWFMHAEVKNICGRFLKERLDQPLLGLIGQSASMEMQVVCRNFIVLQEARHSSDYDLSYVLTEEQALQYVRFSLTAIRAWERIRNSAEANIFILSLLLWRKWESER